jgi:TolA-binding protein
MKKIVFTLSCIASSLLANEISVFDAGNLDIKTPYGLNNTEKQILKTKQEIDSFDTKLKVLNEKTNGLQTSIEGIQGLSDSYSNSINSLSAKILELEKKMESKDLQIDELKKSIQQLRISNQTAAKTQDTNNAMVKKLIAELGDAVSEINKNYVSAKEFKTNLEQLSAKQQASHSVPEPQKQAVKKNEESKKIEESKKVEEQKKVEPVKLSKKESKKVEELKEEESKNWTDGKTTKIIFDESKKLFDNKSFEKSLVGFSALAEKKYKPAESNYYLGLISFQKKDFRESIDFFKKSALLNDNARYIPDLLLKSAESFEKLENKENAKKFYQALADGYPDSKEAKTATKKLSKFK